ncbi:MAG: DJ-1/PfpI family protein [Terriglobales bacterium]
MAEKRLAGTTVLMVIAPDQFRDEELFTPEKILTENGATVRIASTKLGEAKGMLGGTAKPELTIADAKAHEYDAVVVVGGMGSPDYLWDDAKLHALIRELHKENKVIAAICLSGAVLANAGVLNGKRATVWPMPESLAALKEGKAQYVEQPVVHDGKTITANGPEAAHEFAELIVSELSKVKV